MGQRANVNHLCGRSGVRCVIASPNAPVGLGYSRVLGENPSNVWGLVWRTYANRFSSVCNAAKTSQSTCWSRYRALWNSMSQVVAHAD